MVKGNTKKILTMVLLALLVAVIVGLVFLSSIFFETPKEFIMQNDRGEYVAVVINCSLPRVPRSIPVFSPIKHDYTEAEAKIFEVFDITGDRSR